MADVGGTSQFVDFFNRRRKRACRTKVVVAAPTNDHGVHLRFILRDSESNSRALKFESASDEEKHEIERSLASISEAKDALLGCGSSADYEKLRLIRSGAHGAVYKAFDKRTGETVAIKENLSGASILTLREIDIHKSLRRHTNIVEFREAVADASNPDAVCIVTEHVDFDLRGYVGAADGFSTGDAKMLMQQLLEGVKFLHDNMVMHRDIKPSNILVSRRGVLKICDFGLAKRMEAEGAAYSTDVGTTGYRAPEMEMGMEEYWEAVDMWAVGCVMAQMLSGCVGGAGSLLEAVHRFVSEDEEGEVLLRRELFPAEVVTDVGFDLLKRLLSFNPCTRITAEDALDHAWFEER